MHWEDRFRQLASLQFGVIGLGQLGDLGCGGTHWGRAARSSRWEPLSRRVLRLAGCPTTDGQRAMAAILDAGGGAILHGPSTLAWAGLRGFDLREVHVVRRRETTRKVPTLASLHRLRGLCESDVITLRGVPSTTIVRAIWAEASRWSDPRLFEYGVRRLGGVLDEANRKRLLTWAELHVAVDGLGGRGRAGTRLMRALAAERPPGSSPTESRNEDRLEEIVRRAGMTPLRRQVLVGGARPIGRVDHRAEDLPLVVETNSVAHHSLPSDRERDLERYAGLVAAGFAVAVIWEDALWSHTTSVIETLGEGRRLAASGRPGVIHSAGCPWPADVARVVGASRRSYRG